MADTEAKDRRLHLLTAWLAGLGRLLGQKVWAVSVHTDERGENVLWWMLGSTPPWAMVT